MDSRNGIGSVLMVLDGAFPSTGGGGAESQVRTLCLELLRRGVDVLVVVPMLKAGPQVSQDELDGIPVRRIRYPQIRLVGGACMLLRLAALLVRCRHKYDVLHSHIAGNMCVVCCVVGRLLRKPVWVKITGSMEMVGGILDSRPPLSSRIRKLAIRQANGFQATSSRIAHLLVDNGFPQSRVRLVRNAVDTERFGHREVKDFHATRAVRFRAIYTGRLEREKGVDILMQAWAQALHGKTDAALIIVGAGSEQGNLLRLANELGIASQVDFVGATAQPERYLSLANIAVLPSRYEGLSNALLEYMAAALPVAGSKVSGTEDFVIAGTTGWLFAPDDVGALARALSDAYTARPEHIRWLGENGRAMVARQASTTAVVDQLLLAYSGCE